MTLFTKRCLDILIYIFVLFIAIKNDKKTAQKIVNNLINENIFPLKVSSMRQDVLYLGITNLCQNTYSTYKSFNIPVFNI